MSTDLSNMCKGDIADVGVFWLRCIRRLRVNESPLHVLN